MPPLLVPVTRAVFWEDIVADRCKSMQELVEGVDYRPCERLQAKNILQRMRDESPSLEGRGMQFIYPHIPYPQASDLGVATTYEQGTPLETTCHSFRTVAFLLGSSEIQGFNCASGPRTFAVTATISNAGWPDWLRRSTTWFEYVRNLILLGKYFASNGLTLMQ